MRRAWHSGILAQCNGCWEHFAVPDSGTQNGYSHLAVSWLAWILGRQIFAAGKKMILKDLQEVQDWQNIHDTCDMQL